MNLPNKLTVMRMALIPVFLVFMLVESIPHRYLIAAVIFAAASFTDYLDGHIRSPRRTCHKFRQADGPAGR